MTTNDPLDSRPGISFEFQGNPVNIPQAPAPVAINGLPMNVWLAGVQDLWNEGYTGEGMVIGLIDSGVDPDHPAVQCTSTGKPKVIKQVDMTTPEVDDPPAGVGTNFFHGTTMAGYMAGWSPDGYRGAAPDAQIISYWVFNGDIGNPDPDTNPEHVQIIINRVASSIFRAVRDGCHIINMSLGPRQSTVDEHNLDLSGIEQALQHAYLNNVIVFIASGNVEPDFNAYAKFPTALGVGSIDYQPLRGLVNHSDFSSTNKNGNRVVDITQLGGSLNPCTEAQFGFPFVAMFPIAPRSIDVLMQFFELRGITNVDLGLYGAIFADGTSASTATLSGFAALLRQKHKPKTTAQFRIRVESQIIDLIQPGFDRWTGYGLVTTRPSIPTVQAAGTVEPQCGDDDDEDTAVQPAHVRPAKPIRLLL